MKYFVVVSCLLVAAHAIAPELVEKIKEKVVEHAGECKEEIGVSDADIAPILAHNPPSTDKGKCFIACMNKKFGFQDSEGKISKEGSYTAIEKYKDDDQELYEKLKVVTDTCLGQVSEGSNECETANNMFICVKKVKESVGVETIDFSQ